MIFMSSDLSWADCLPALDGPEGPALVFPAPLGTWIPRVPDTPGPLPQGLELGDLQLCHSFPLRKFLTSSPCLSGFRLRRKLTQTDAGLMVNVVTSFPDSCLTNPQGHHGSQGEVLPPSPPDSLVTLALMPGVLGPSCP